MVNDEIQHAFVAVRGVVNTAFVVIGVGLFFFIMLRHYQLLGSFVLGVLLWALPTVYFTHRVFNRLIDLPPLSLLSRFYHTEIQKLLLGGVFFIAIVRFFPETNLPVLILAYLLAQFTFLVHWAMRHGGASVLR